MHSQARPRTETKRDRVANSEHSEVASAVSIDALEIAIFTFALSATSGKGQEKMREKRNSSSTVVLRSSAFYRPASAQNENDDDSAFIDMTKMFIYILISTIKR